MPSAWWWSPRASRPRASCTCSSRSTATGCRVPLGAVHGSQRRRGVGDGGPRAVAPSSRGVIGGAGRRELARAVVAALAAGLRDAAAGRRSCAARSNSFAVSYRRQRRDRRRGQRLHLHARPVARPHRRLDPDRARCASGSTTTSAPVSAIGWQYGSRSRRPLHAHQAGDPSPPRAGSPFRVPATRCCDGLGRHVQPALGDASRSVTSFAPTSTMRVTPSASAGRSPPSVLEERNSITRTCEPAGAVRCRPGSSPGRSPATRWR